MMLCSIDIHNVPLRVRLLEHIHGTVGRRQIRELVPCNAIDNIQLLNGGLNFCGFFGSLSMVSVLGVRLIRSSY